MNPFVRIGRAPACKERAVARNRGLAGGSASPASPLPRAGRGRKITMPGAPFAALLAAFALFSPDEARAQAAVCTPAQTVKAPPGPGADVTNPSGEANPFTRYTTMIVCECCAGKGAHGG